MLRVSVVSNCYLLLFVVGRRCVVSLLMLEGVVGWV